MVNTLRAACELKNKVRTALFAAVLLTFVPSAFASASAASASAREFSGELRRDLAVAAYGREGGQEHAPATAKPADAPAGEHAQPAGAHEAAGGHDQSIGGMILSMGWQVANFIIFLGVLYYFLNKPFTEYLAGRSSTIRKDLVEAAELRSAATTQLAAIEQKLQALPGEVTALRARGADEIKAEEQRIAAAAAADRERMLEQTRREIDLQVRLAKKDILEHAADLSLQLATDRVKKEVTPADQDRLVDRYLSQVKDTNQ
jgi:F-type H+-transporting ATPase subunit b